MHYIVSKQFEKSFKKLSGSAREKAIARFTIFIANEYDYQLDNHALVGDWTGYRSIDITGNIRAVYIIEKRNIARFVAIGTHAQLYE